MNAVNEVELKLAQQPKLIVLSAPSGAGKTTLCSRLLKAFPQLQLSISSTTRNPRGDEKNGIAYEFLSRKEFESRIQQGLFIEWAKVHGQLYGTSITTLQSIHAAGKIVLLDIDVQGADTLKSKFPNETLRIFISPPSIDALIARLRARQTESEDALKVRVTNAKEEIKAASRFDHELINDDLDQATEKLIHLVRPYLQLSPKGGSLG